jgi:hypothetical protein
LACGGEEIGDPLKNGILHLAGSAAEFPFEDLLLVLLVDMEREISLTDRAAENIHQ